LKQYLGDKGKDYSDYYEEKKQLAIFHCEVCRVPGIKKPAWLAGLVLV
jgi:hypothetical protein